MRYNLSLSPCLRLHGVTEIVTLCQAEPNKEFSLCKDSSGYLKQATIEASVRLYIRYKRGTPLPECSRKDRRQYPAGFQSSSDEGEALEGTGLSPFRSPGDLLSDLKAATLYDVDLEDYRLMATDTLNNRDNRPTHPGELLREEVLPASGINQTELARMIGVSRRTINEIVQEKRGMTPDIAHRLARVFGTGPEVWLNMQTAVDIWDTLEANKEEYENIKPLLA